MSEINLQDILSACDHTLLKQESTWDQIREICQDGMTYHTASVCIPPSFVRQARELVKVGFLKNCFDDIRNVAEALAGRTRSQLVTVIGRKIVLYRPSKTKKVIELP